MRTVSLVLAAGIANIGLSNAADLSAPRIQYQTIQFDVIGPSANENATVPNPFLDIRYDLTLTAPSGERFEVPGFFAGDGQGGGQGDIWRARFAPTEAGSWTYTTALLQGTNAAVQDQTGSLNDITRPEDRQGGFNVSPTGAPAATAEERLQQRGPLRYVGEHYLRFDNGEYWIKGGVDSPENFFGYAGFDNTVNQAGGVGEGQLPNGLHHYAEHVADWNPGDPLFVSANSGVDSKGIIGSINYLASQGINSMYFLLMNLGGDGRDTYPFIGTSGSGHDNKRYDVSKLSQWNSVLEHMQSKGITAHLVLGEQEVENRTWLDNGELGVERKLFYREMVARFAHLNALKWNISEESRYGNQRHKDFAAYIRSLDWIQHPIAVHSFVDDPAKAYDALIGDPLFSITSIQFSADKADEFTESWRDKTNAIGRPWVIDMDEVGPGDTGLTEGNSEQLRRDVLYPVYFSGGNIEWYFGYQAADIRTENFRTREPMYRYMLHARNFMQQHLPFWEMHPNDEALLGGDTNDQVFEKAGEVYAVYLNQGNQEPSLKTAPGNYTVQWFNPINGKLTGPAIDASGSLLELGAAPAAPQQDWVVLIKRKITQGSGSSLSPAPEQSLGLIAPVAPITTDESAVEVAPVETEAVTEPVETNPGQETVEAETTSETSEPPPQASDSSATDNQPDLAAAEPVKVGAAYIDNWFLLIGLFGLLQANTKLLSGIRRRRVLLAALHVLRIERIKINRV